METGAEIDVKEKAQFLTQKEKLQAVNLEPTIWKES